MTNEYHSIFAPLGDVYKLSGPEVFKHLQGKDGKKNLIIIPPNIPRELNSPSEIFSGGKDSLEYLARQTNTELTEEFLLHHLSPNLDVGYLLHQDLTAYNNIQKPTIITTDNEQTLYYRSKNFKVENPEFSLVDKNIVNEGVIIGNDSLLTKLYSTDNSIPQEEAESILGKKLHLNQFVKFIDANNKTSVYSVVQADLQKHEGSIIRVNHPRLELITPNSKGYSYGGRFVQDIFGVKPRNSEQFLALQYGLLNLDVGIAFICGSQGSGKTLLAYTAAVSLICDYVSKGKSNPSPAEFEQIVLIKPNDPMGGKKRDTGFLPGNLWDKLQEDLQPFEDAHNCSSLNCFNFYDMVLHPKRENKYGPKREFNGVINNHWKLPSEREAFRVLSSAKSRGVSLKNTIMIIDESQNFTPYEIKTLVSRLGYGSKAILLGDPDQFDNPCCSRDINGLTAAIHHFIEKPHSFLINLNRNFRSQVSRDTLDWNVYSG